MMINTQLILNYEISGQCLQRSLHCKLETQWKEVFLQESYENLDFSERSNFILLLAWFSFFGTVLWDMCRKKNFLAMSQKLPQY